jgi:hypothetical protein
VRFSLSSNGEQWTVYKKLSDALWDTLCQDWKGEYRKDPPALAVRRTQRGVWFDPGRDGWILFEPSKSKLSLDSVMGITAERLDLDLEAETMGRVPGVKVLLLHENSNEIFEQTGLVCLGSSKQIYEVKFPDAHYNSWRVDRQGISERASTFLIIENRRIHTIGLPYRLIEREPKQRRR